jgi:hypothetical protein
MVVNIPIQTVGPPITPHPQRYQQHASLKPEQLRYFMDSMLDVYREEVHDAETRERIIARFTEIDEQLDREIEAARQPLVPSRDQKNHRGQLRVSTQATVSPLCQPD